VDPKSPKRTTPDTGIVNPLSKSPLLIIPPHPVVRQGHGSQTEADSLNWLYDPVGMQLDPTVHLASSPAVSSWKGYEPASPLFHELQTLIGITGRPISTADYIRMCLTHEQHGYYKHAQSATRDMDDDDFFPGERKNIIIGPGGDFVTAPEISSVFTEMVAVWLHTQWQSQQRIGPPGENSDLWEYLECGPGKGTLVVDFLDFIFDRLVAPPRADEADVNSPPKHGFARSLQNVHLIETSPALRHVQFAKLNDWIHRRAAKKSSRPLDVQFPNEHFVASSTDTRLGKNRRKKTSIADTEKGSQTIHIYWHDSIAAFLAWRSSSRSKSPPGTKVSNPMAIYGVAQEFLDALPVYSFEKCSEGYWRERLVDIAALPELLPDDTDEERAIKQQSISEQERERDSARKKPRLRLVMAPEVTPPLTTMLPVDEEGFVVGGASTSGGGSESVWTSAISGAPAGSVIEVCPEAIFATQDLAKMIDASQRGAFLFIDYGNEGSTDSIRAFHKHEQVSFLSQPGRVDITADVDFAALKHAVNDASSRDKLQLPATGSVHAYGPVPQGEFLMKMGLQERVIQLIEMDSTTEEQAEALYEAMVRLADSGQMGQRYKVLALTTSQSGDDNLPPGFE
jgi:NADH dehydrogenase [ubiquinone] 1 alpha subcomplex assembly factor 7